MPSVTVRLLEMTKILVSKVVLPSIPELRSVNALPLKIQKADPRARSRRRVPWNLLPNLAEAGLSWLDVTS
jgi:hypothetical protein